MRIGTLLLALVCVFCMSAGDAVAAGHWEITSAPGIYSGTPTDFNCLGQEGTCWKRYKWVEDGASTGRTGIYIPSLGRGFANGDVRERTNDDGTISFSVGGSGIVETDSEDELLEILSSGR